MAVGQAAVLRDSELRAAVTAAAAVGAAAPIALTTRVERRRRPFAALVVNAHAGGSAIPSFLGAVTAAFLSFGDPRSASSGDVGPTP